MRLLTFSNVPLETHLGSGYVITEFARGLNARGHAVRLVGPEACIVWPRLGVGRSWRLALGMRHRVDEMIRSERPDIVEFWGGEACLAVRHLADNTRRGFKIVARSNGLEPFVEEERARYGVPNSADGAAQRWYQGKLRLPYEQGLTRADAIVTVGQPDADYALRRKFQPHSRVLAINNALPENFLGRPFNPERPKRIGYCGSWLRVKGTPLLVADLTAVLRGAPDWSLHLVGVGAEFRAEAHFPADVCPQITVTAHVADRRDLRSHYDTWRLAVMPSFVEPFGLVAAEAMACGCALVASRTGFAASLDHEREALLIAPVSPQLAHAVRQLIADDPLRRRVAEAGWRRVQSLRWAGNIATLETFYSDLLKSR